MGFLKFSILTVIGSAIWRWLLAVLGQKVGHQLKPAQTEDFKAGKGVDLSHLIHAVKHESLWIVGIVVIVCALYVPAKRLTDKKP